MRKDELSGKYIFFKRIRHLLEAGHVHEQQNSINVFINNELIILVRAMKTKNKKNMFMKCLLG